MATPVFKQFGMVMVGVQSGEIFHLPIELIKPTIRFTPTNNSLREWMRRTGFCEALVLDSNFTIIRGAAHYTYAKEFGWKTLPCRFA